MLAVKNLVRHRLRSALTLLGVAVSVALSFSLTTFADGLRGQVDDLLAANRIDLVIQMQNASTPMSSRLSPADYAALNAMPEVAEVSGVLLGSMRVGLVQYTFIVGVDAVEPLAARLAFLKGGMFTPGKKELILGANRAAKYRYELGKTMTLAQGETFTIAGIYQTGTALFDDAVAVSLSDARRLLKRQDDYNLALVRLKKGLDQEAGAAAVQSLLPDLSATPSGEMGTSVVLFRTVQAVTWIMSLIALAVSCLIVANTLIMSVAERTRELGVLMAIGWSRARVVGMVLTEALVLCLAGGALGVALGYGLMQALTHSSVTGLDWVPPSFNLPLLARSMGLSLAVGLVASLVPAWLVTRLSPCEALRWE
jgi:putative ABC transport system permease protein